jgi:acyl-[acyl-carrier-protein]-phospholipid O-acyltransferase/long-chain-fatty-acid--[acyl-carrier-protein] ligase
VHEARSHPGRQAIADSAKAKLSYGDTLLRACVLARVLRRTLGPEQYVGLLLPPTVPSAVANLAVALLGKTPVNLNYTVSQAMVDSSIAQCGIKQVITAQKVLDRVGITPSASLVMLDEVPKQVTAVDKAWGAFVAKFVPTPWLGRFLPGLRGNRLDEVATVIFTSGSTGEPKGVVLSERNILSNVHQIASHLRLLPDESVLGILPFFHSFGYTVTIWTVLCLGKRVVYHFNPLDARTIGELCEEHDVTMITTTPTFMRTYLKKCTPKQFSKLVHLLLGA